MKKLVLLSISIACVASLGFAQKTKPGNGVKDAAGNSYGSVVFDHGQEWMTENLNVDQFRNGDAISQVKTVEEWEKANREGQPAWCYYKFDNANKGCGKLYNKAAVYDRRGLAPEGWDIPTAKQLETFEEPYYWKDNKARELRAKDEWTYFDRECKANNKSGFSAIPCGCIYSKSRGFGGSKVVFQHPNETHEWTGDQGSLWWWAKDDSQPYFEVNSVLPVDSMDASRFNISGCDISIKKNQDWSNAGFAVRCIKLK